MSRMLESRYARRSVCTGSENRAAFEAPKQTTPQESIATAPPGALTLQFLAWVESRPRTYAEAMEAWRSSCPRLSVWDDAVLDGLVWVERGDEGGMGGCEVTLTARGRAMLGRN